MGKVANRILWQPNPGPQTDFLRRTEFEVLYGGAAGGGKMLPLDTPLPTPHGWTTMGDVQVGDELFDESGRVCRVVAVFPVQTPDEAYRLTFDDGVSIDACGDHLWLTYDAKELAALTRRDPVWRARRRAKRPSRAKGNKSQRFVEVITARNRACPPPVMPAPSGSVRSTREIAQTLLTQHGRRNHAIPVAMALELPHVDLPLDPYLLGCWLGDGHTHAGRITTADPEIAAAYLRAGFEVVRYHSDDIDYGIHGLSSILRSLGVLGDKHIPVQYLRASREQRLALLQGLMDTDGTVARNSGAAEFTTTSPAIRCGMEELVRSLGWKVRVREGRAKLNGIDHGPKWTMKWMASEPVFRLERKLRLQRIATRRTTRFRYVVSCDPIEPVPMRCIAVDSQSHLYLAGRAMVPTHNSDALVIEALRQVAHPRYRAVIFRRTLTEASELIDRSRLYYPAAGGVWREQQKEWKFPSGAIIRFRYLENVGDELRYQGHEYQYIAFDELTHFDERQYLYLLSRCRTSDPALRCYVRAASNPGGPGHHWVKARFIDVAPPGKTYVDPVTGLTRCFVPARVFDNPILLRADPLYLKRLESLPEAERKALLLGDWDAFAGQVFSEWRRDVHVVEPFAIPAGWLRFRAMDWGFSKPYCILWFAVDYNGVIYVYRELYGLKPGCVDVGTQETAREVAQKVKAAEDWKNFIADEGVKLETQLSGEKIAYGVADPACWAKTGHDGPSIAETFASEGVFWKPADNDRLQGKMQVHLRLRGWGPERPGLKVFNTCTNLIRTLPALCYDAHRPEDVDTTQEDHAYDALRYGLMSRPWAPPKEKQRKRDAWAWDDEEKTTSYMSV
ncbi:protein of unknown function DUF264 [Thermosinus carboxydivorans Nor1]|uniref:DOD-type homing endonuclease domain-containing protein n=2 Tax=Thermosinus TaxID=261684 RepID=A1HR49_9FIRM|nr:protein of unknown function DUF264 [Thermosinus carboxydivorans Nor1]